MQTKEIRFVEEMVILRWQKRVDSNVEPVVEITKMIEVQRAYQHSTETLNATDDIIRRAVQRLGDIKA